MSKSNTFMESVRDTVVATCAVAFVVLVFAVVGLWQFVLPVLGLLLVLRWLGVPIL